MRHVDVYDDLSALKIVERIAHLAGAIEVVEPVPSLDHAWNCLRLDARAGGDDKIVICEGLARLRLYAFGLDVDMLGRIDEERDALVEDLALIPVELRFANFAEGHIEQARLIHVFVAGAEHGDLDGTGAELRTDLPAKPIGNNCSGHSSADDQDLLCHAVLPLFYLPGCAHFALRTKTLQ